MELEAEVATNGHIEPEVDVVKRLLALGQERFAQVLFVEAEALWRVALSKLTVVERNNDESGGWGQGGRGESDSSSNNSNPINTDNIDDTNVSSSSSDKNGEVQVQLATVFGLKFSCLCRLSLLYKKLNRMIEANIVAKQALDVVKMHFKCAKNSNSNSNSSSNSSSSVIELSSDLLNQLIGSLNTLVFDPYERVEILFIPDISVDGDTLIQRYSLKEFREIRDNMVNINTDDQTHLLKNYNRYGGNISANSNYNRDNNSTGNSNNKNNNRRKHCDISSSTSTGNSETGPSSKKIIVKANKKPKAQ